MDEFYIVLEIQAAADGTRGCIPLIYDSYDAALAKLYSILAVAAVSGLPYHAGCILRSDNTLVTDGRAFVRDAEIEA